RTAGAPAARAGRNRRARPATAAGPRRPFQLDAQPRDGGLNPRGKNFRPDAKKVLTTLPHPRIISRLSSAPVAQLDRVPGYEPGGREFESLRARHFSRTVDFTVDGLFLPRAPHASHGPARGLVDAARAHGP